MKAPQKISVTKKQSKMLSVDDILSSKDSVIARVEVPEWGGHVYVKSLTAHERDVYETMIMHYDGKTTQLTLDNARAKLLVCTACDATGNLIFSAATDIKELAKKSARAVDRVFAKAQEINGVSQEDIDALVKN